MKQHFFMFADVLVEAHQLPIFN